MISLDAVAGFETHDVVRPELVKIQIGRGATSPVSGHARLAAVGIEDAHAEVGGLNPGRPDDRDAVAACAIMTIANAARKIAKVTHCGELFTFKDDVVVAESLELSESHFLECGGLTPLFPRRIRTSTGGCAAYVEEMKLSSSLRHALIRLLAVLTRKRRQAAALQNGYCDLPVNDASNTVIASIESCLTAAASG